MTEEKNKNPSYGISQIQEIHNIDANLRKVAKKH